MRTLPRVIEPVRSLMRRRVSTVVATSTNITKDWRSTVLRALWPGGRLVSVGRDQEVAELSRIPSTAGFRSLDDVVELASGDVVETPVTPVTEARLQGRVHPFRAAAQEGVEVPLL